MPAVTSLLSAGVAGARPADSTAFSRIGGMLPGLAGKYTMHQRCEVIEIRRGIVGIKRGLIPVAAEFHAGVVVWMRSIALAGVRVQAVMVGVVMHLKQPVMTHHPGDLGAHVRLDDGGRIARMVLRRQIVAQI